MRFSHSLTVAALASLGDAFPALRDLAITPRAEDAGVGEPNSGFFPNVGFNAKDQYVDVSPGSGHEWQAPRATDIRGPCPGLNAAANHGFISRTGVLNYEDTTFGLAKAYNLGLDFSNVLFVFSVLNSGSILNMEWSIGGPIPGQDNLGGLLGGGLGISNSHNKYEGDSSPGRGDAYLHNGDAHSLNIENYGALYALQNKDGTFDMDILRKHVQGGHEYSVKNNPYFFAGPVFFVPPIAHQFIVAMMSNYSESHVQGILTKDTLNSFFSVKEHKNGKLQWIKGHERIPDNWYKRPSTNMYGIVPSFGDFGLTVKQYPDIGEVGGNTGKVNSFSGVNLGDLTGGVFTAQDLLKGNNLACFAFQATLAGLPGATQKILDGVGPFFKLANKIIGPTLVQLNCPQLTKYNSGLFEKYPGFKHKEPEQPDEPW